MTHCYLSFINFILLEYPIYNLVKANVSDLKLILLYFNILIINNINSLIYIMINVLILL